MKTISSNIILTSVRSKADGSLGLSLSTPELTPNEKVAFMELHNLECAMLLKPLGIKDNDILKIDKEANEKSPSQRLRAALYVYYEQNNIEEDFEVFYRRKIENIINKIKDKLL